MADDWTDRERAAAQELAARWRYAADLVFPPDVSRESAEAWLGVARVALRAADGVDVRNAADPWAPSPLGRLVSIDPVTGEQLNEAQIRAKLPRHG